MREFFTTILDYLSQSGADWVSMSDALDNNIIAIILLIISYGVLCISFYTVGGLLIKPLKKKGAFNKSYTILGRWFVILLFLVGTTFGAQIVTMFYPFYWIYAGVLATASTSALLTVLIYIKYFKSLTEIPSLEVMQKLEQDYNNLKQKEEVLRKSLSIWSKNTDNQIELLKKEYTKLSEELSVHKEVTRFGKKEEDLRTKTLEVLNKVNKELTALTEVLK